MFKKPISTKHRNEIAELAIEHRDALLAYGSDMYKHGLKDAVKYLAVGCCISYTIIGSIDMAIKKHRNIHN